VEKLLMSGAFPVDTSTRKIFFPPSALGKLRGAHLCVRFRDSLRLTAAERSIELTAFPNNNVRCPYL
jgi:hypothetical protein